MPRFSLTRLALTALLLPLLSGCAELPSLQDRPASPALGDTSDTRLGRAIAPRAARHPGESGIVPLTDGRDALAARVLLANQAERSLDLRYYIWQHDLSGTMLFAALRRAAERGVRVRLLLDDNNTDGLGPILLALDRHRNIQVRLFNPFVHRNQRWLGYLTDFPRLNRRMHNKSMTADGQATIIGGRNVGDEYFDAGDDFSYADLDVLAIGPVVESVRRDFERYWASDSAYPARRLLADVEPAGRRALAPAAADRAAAERYARSLTETSFVRALVDGGLEFVWARTRLISDDPAKALGRGAQVEPLTERMERALGPPTRELLLVSPYFVPTQAGARWLIGLEERGVEVTVLTNALEATDVVPVHAGYAKWREPLLRAGVTLYEMRADAAPETARDRGLTGSSASSLHAKTAAVDGKRLYVGSFNFDPRSARLNTEMGLVIESPELARAMASLVQRMPARSYEVRLAGGGLQWIERENGRTIVHGHEPGAGLWMRLTIALLSALPIEWLL